MKWPSGELGQQVGNQIFLVKTGNQGQQKINWKYVLAPSDETFSQYLPAEVIQTDPFRVKIFNQSRSENVILFSKFLTLFKIENRY